MALNRKEGLVTAFQADNKRAASQAPFGIFDSKIVATRDNGTIRLTDGDLEAEARYKSVAHSSPETVNQRIHDLKNRIFQMPAYAFDNLTKDEHDVLVRIYKYRRFNECTGEEILNVYLKSSNVQKEGLAMGMAWLGDTLLYLEHIMNALPELLDSLVEKGRLIESPAPKCIQNPPLAGVDTAQAVAVVNSAASQAPVSTVDRGASVVTKGIFGVEANKPDNGAESALDIIEAFIQPPTSGK